MQKIFAHYELLRDDDPGLRRMSFGEFFYRIDFSLWRIRIMIKLGSLFLLAQTNSEVAARKDVATVNLFIKRTLVFIGLALIVLTVGLLTGRIR